jgi:Domain of unknown function (DUF1707)
LVDVTDDDAVAAQPTATAQAVRASDAERAAAAERVQVALVEGRLDIGETEERLATIYAARYRSDLPRLLADLPTPDAGHSDVSWASLWQAIVVQIWMSSARARGVLPEPPDRRQQRAVSVVLIAAALWATVCMLAGISVGLFS